MVTLEKLYLVSCKNGLWVFVGGGGGCLNRDCFVLFSLSLSPFPSEGQVCRERSWGGGELVEEPGRESGSLIINPVFRLRLSLAVSGASNSAC